MPNLIPQIDALIGMMEATFAGHNCPYCGQAKPGEPCPTLLYVARELRVLRLVRAQYLDLLDAIAWALRVRCVRRREDQAERLEMARQAMEDIREAASIAYQNGVESVGDE
jgi:hypothetical protein